MDVHFSRIDAFIDLILQCDTLDDCFAGFTKSDPSSDLETEKLLQERLIDIFKSVSKDELEKATKYYLNSISNIVNFDQSEKLFQFLGQLLNLNLIEYTSTCTEILRNSAFKIENQVYWVNSLKFMRSIIHKVKYKDVRDIYAILLLKIPSIPRRTDCLVYKQVNTFYELFQFIMDREVALLPAYLVQFEILNKFLPREENEHWKFSKLISNFMNSFRPVAKMVSLSGRPKLLPIVGYSFPLNSLKLDHVTARYKLKSSLPYDKEIYEPQYDLLLSIIEQGGSRETIGNILSLNKIKESRQISIENGDSCTNIIENLLIELFMKTINKTLTLRSFNNIESLVKNNESPELENEFSRLIQKWNHIWTQYLNFELGYSVISVGSFANTLHERLATSTEIGEIIRKCRELIMWTLLQILSYYYTKNSLDSCLVLFKFFDLLYPDKQPIKVPSEFKPNSVYIMSAACIWILLSKSTRRQIPVALVHHVEYLQNEIFSHVTHNPNNEALMAIAFNSSIANDDQQGQIRGFLLDKVTQRSNNSSASQVPISMNLLDSLNYSTRKCITTTSPNSILSQLCNSAQAKPAFPLPSALIETFSRLMAYSDLEFDVKNIHYQLLNFVLRNQNWNSLYNLLEMFTLRLHHVSCANEIQLLRQLYHKSTLSQMNHIYLYWAIENAALKIINGLNLTELLLLCTTVPRITDESINFLPPDSEELNKAFVLTLARSFHVTGGETLAGERYTSCVNDILSDIKQNTNSVINWPSFTLNCFPVGISHFYEANVVQKESAKVQLKKSVEEEYRKWKSMTIESDKVKYFTSPGTPNLFYCLLYKMYFEDATKIPMVAFKILDRIGVRALSAHLRLFIDFLVYEFSNAVGANLNQITETLNSLIWKPNISVLTMDRLLLCLALRGFEENDAKVCVFVIQQILLKNQALKTRVNDFVKDVSPEHWMQSNFAEIHSFFLKNYPESSFQNMDYMADGNAQGNVFTPLFSNVCLRMLPVLDIIIHRLIEMPIQLNNQLPSQNQHHLQVFEQLLDQYGCLYKFHDKPITFLYTTLFYYESKIRDNHKRKLVYTIINAFKDVKPKSWAVTDIFLNYCYKSEDEIWNPGSEYFKMLIGRLVNTLSPTPSVKSSYPKFPYIDHRFNEFPNDESHALHAVCVEIMSQPGNPADVGNALLNVVLENHKNLPLGDIELWINATAMVFTLLPTSYSSVISERILDLFKNPQLLEDKNLYYLVDFKNSHLHMSEYEISYPIALAQSYWNHGSFGAISLLTKFIRDRIKPLIQTEEQFLLVCYLVGPFLQRCYSERTRCVMEITLELYEMLEIINNKGKELKHFDIICDLLYHIKYNFTGDNIRTFVEAKLRNLRPELLRKLRFVTNIKLDQISNS